ncbi:MAG: DUF1634 domain-containing protein [Planctomycetes bacterium]|nr:DUF1634 domain-containing protein [Planctomycetota bacterium]
MSGEHDEACASPREQVIYANMLLLGVWVGLFALLLTYTIYLTGLLPPEVPIAEIPQHWHKGVDEFLAVTGGSTGWSWAGRLNRGDFLNYVPFALLGLTSIVCYLVLLANYVQARNRIFSVMVALEILVLSVAASGILGGGGH